MRLADLSTAALDIIRARRFDQIAEKHEGPERWETYVKHAEFLEIGSFQVLLPLYADELPKVQIMRCIPSADGETLTIFLRNRRYLEAYEIAEGSPNAMFYDGFLAVCQKISDEAFYVADVYHEWFVVDNPA